VRRRHDDAGVGVVSGESLVDGLRRELAEELRCDPVVGDPLSTFWYAHLGSPLTLSRYTAFSCSIPHDVRPARTEGILASTWVVPDDPPARTLPQVRFLLRDDAHPLPSPTRR
jgi:8-oxo-dGTP pyrophosphatase MutT (NUDIX family)